MQFQGIHNFTVDDFDNTDFVIAGTNGNDVITGTEGDDRIFAAGGDDQVFALGGDDEVHGGDGNDTIDGGLGGFDQLFGEAGDDTLTLGEGGTASGGDGNDFLVGSDDAFSFADLQGGAGNDTLQAGAGRTSLIDLDGGDDILIGGQQTDQYFGGAGADLFVFGPQWNDGGFGEFVEDFTRADNDKIDLRNSGLAFDDLTIQDDEFGGFSGIITSTLGRVEVNGMGSQGNGPLVESDFLFT